MLHCHPLSVANRWLKGTLLTVSGAAFIGTSQRSVRYPHVAVSTTGQTEGGACTKLKMCP